MSILNDVKVLTGVQSTNTGFDAMLLLHIGSVAAEIKQLGVDVFEAGGVIDADTEWPIFDNDIIGALTKQLLGLKVKFLFDPSPNETIMKSFQGTKVELEGRLLHEIDEVANV